MSKPALGAVLGAVLGLLDGLSALFYPEAAPMIVQIVTGSTIKGLVQPPPAKHRGRVAHRPFDPR